MFFLLSSFYESNTSKRSSGTNKGKVIVAGQRREEEVMGFLAACVAQHTQDKYLLHHLLLRQTA